jgi:hypothetical protein
MMWIQYDHQETGKILEAIWTKPWFVDLPRIALKTKFKVNGYLLQKNISPLTIFSCNSHLKCRSTNFFLGNVQSQKGQLLQKLLQQSEVTSGLGL